MKKHAKRSLWLPILVLFSVVAIVAGCYLNQTFSANAEEAESALAPEFGVTAATADEIGKTNNGESNAYDTLWAKIQFSTKDMIFASVETLDDTYPLWPTEELFYQFVNDENDVAYLDWDQVSENEIVIFGVPYFTDVIHIQIPMNNYVDTVNFRYIDDYTVEANIVLQSYYELCFDANGGYFVDEAGNRSVYQYVNEDPGDELQFPHNPSRENYIFLGWFTQRWGGEQVFEYIQTPPFGTYWVLYAHWAPVSSEDQLINVNFADASFFTQFKYEISYEKYDFTGFVEGDSAYGSAHSLSLNDLYLKYSELFTGDYEFNKLSIDDLYDFTFYANNSYYDSDFICLWWVAFRDDYDWVWTLNIYPSEGHHIDWALLNGSVIPEDGYLWESLNINNNVLISQSLNLPGFITVASDDGSLFKCRYIDEATESSEFVSDYVPIFVEPDEYVSYYYYLNRRGMGALDMEENNEFDANNDMYGFSLVISISSEDNNRCYVFSDFIVSIFDWLDINSYIKGVDLDGEDVPVGGYYDYYSGVYVPFAHRLINGYHTFTLNMTDKEADTTVTYKANGGKFADDSDTMTLDARFGEPLPIVENPKAIDNDFVGWFTEPEGGVQVDPEHFIWMPWQRETGVTLYAHWAYNPQPVPPEPVPPEPGPTPEPVNPDVPGGGGTAQTGDSMPLVPIAALAVIAALGCGLAIRKEF